MGGAGSVILEKVHGSWGFAFNDRAAVVGFSPLFYLFFGCLVLLFQDLPLHGFFVYVFTGDSWIGGFIGRGRTSRETSTQGRRLVYSPVSSSFTRSHLSVSSHRS